MMKKIINLYCKFAEWYYDEWKYEPAVVFWVSFFVLVVGIGALIGVIALFVYFPIVMSLIFLGIGIILGLIFFTVHIGEKIS